MLNQILGFFIDRRLLIKALILVIIAGGIFSTTRIKQDVFPETEIDTMMITVKYPGASASDVEQNAVQPIEDALANIQGIKKYDSFSIANGGTIFTYLDPDIIDKRAVKDEIYREITLSKLTEIPAAVIALEILDMNPKFMSVYSVALQPKNVASFSEQKLLKLAATLEQKFRSLSLVSTVRKSGYRDQEIHVNVNPEKMKEHHVSLQEIMASIQNRNIRSTGGTLQSLDKDQQIVTIGQFESLKSIKEVIIRSGFEGQRVQIKDVATIKSSLEKAFIKVRVNQVPSVVFQIVKKENADIVKTTEQIQSLLKTLKKDLPQEFELIDIEDKSLSIRAMIKVVLSNALIGFVLVVLILMIFLDFKTAFWTAFGIPVSLLLVFIYMYLINFSFNLMTLGAIITVLGMLVDHGIIIAETIYQRKKQGISAKDAAVKGVSSVVLPVIVTVLTTIVAFLPILSVKGLMGKFVYVFPIIISATLAASLLEALFILPAHLAHSKPVVHKGNHWFDPVISGYGKLLKICLRFRYITVLSIIGITVVSFLISQDVLKNFVLLWDDSSDAIYINLEAPVGTILSATETLTRKIEKKVSEIIPESERLSILTTIGHHTVKRITSKGNHENWSQVVVNLVPRSARKRTASQIIDSIRTSISIKQFPEFKRILYEEKLLGPPAGEGVKVKVVSSNLEKAESVQHKLEKFLKQQAGVLDVDNDQKAGKEELLIRFNFELMARYGIQVSQVAATIRVAYEGIEVSSYQPEAEKFPIRIQIHPDFKHDKQFLENLLIQSKSGRLYPLKTFAVFTRKKGLSVINHTNGKRVVTITGTLDSKKTTATKIAQSMKKYIQLNLKQVKGVRINIGGEAKTTTDTLSGLTTAFTLAIGLIFLVLMVQFNSIILPVFVLAVIPFSLVGVFIAFHFHSLPMSFMGIIGCIGLAGVVVNDSLVMVDFIREKISNNLNRPKADFINLIVEGAKLRFTAVVLTTLTTVAGLMPTVYGLGGDVKSLVPVVMAMAYGLLFSTILTLLLIPCLYFMGIDISQIIRIFKSRSLARSHDIS